MEASISSERLYKGQGVSSGKETRARDKGGQKWRHGM